MSSRDVSFASFDGLELHGTLDEPSGQCRGTAVLVHGMTADRTEWGLFDEMADFLRDEGIASLRFDYRCHGVDKTPIRDLSLLGISNDIASAWEFLTDALPGTMLRFAVSNSFGGGVLVEWARRSRAPAALFLCAPVLDYEADIAKTAGDWREQLSSGGVVNYVGQELGRPLLNEIPFLDASSSLVQLDCRIVFLHGDQDSDVPIEQSMLFMTKAPNATLYAIAGAEHGFGVPGDPDFEDPRVEENYQEVFKLIRQELQQLLERRP